MTGGGGLALAALGFSFCTWLSRVALAVPVLLLVLSMLRPDSQEALALRLHKELQRVVIDPSRNVTWRI